MRTWESLTKAEQAVYVRTVCRTHERRITLLIQTLAGKQYASFTEHYLGGSREADASRTPAEILNVRVYDPDGLLDWQAGEHYGYRARVIDARFVPGIGDGEWVETVCFTGPLWDVERSGPEASLVAHSMERAAMGTVRSTIQQPRKTRVTKVIRLLLAAAGAKEEDLLIPGLKATLPENLTVRKVVKGKKGKKENKAKGPRVFRATASDSYYPPARRLAAALNRQLLATRHGKFQLRRWPTAKNATVRLDESNILDPVKFKRAGRDDLKNRFTVVGRDPKGKKKPPRASRAIPSWHPLSPEKMGWNGKPKNLEQVEQLNHVRTGKQAAAVARRKADAAMRSSVGVEVSALPVCPWILPGDMVTVRDPASGVTKTIRARQFTYPLTAWSADPLTIGVSISETVSKPKKQAA